MNASSTVIYMIADRTVAASASLAGAIRFTVRVDGFFRMEECSVEFGPWRTETSMIRLKFAILSLVIFTARIAIARDYVLRIEMTTDVESKVADGKPVKSSDVRTLEIAIAPERRFHGKTTWENQRLAMKGNLTEERDGTLRLDIRCEHSVKTMATEQREDGSAAPSFENLSTTNTTIAIAPGRRLTIGGFGTTQTIATPDGNREEMRLKTFRVTVVEDADDES
jgi:hypothetical protein